MQRPVAETQVTAPSVGLYAAGAGWRKSGDDDDNDHNDEYTIMIIVVDPRAFHGSGKSVCLGIIIIIIIILPANS